MVILIKFVNLMNVVKEKVMFVIKSVRIELIIVKGSVEKIISGWLNDLNCMINILKMNRSVIIEVMFILLKDLF